MRLLLLMSLLFATLVVCSCTEQNVTKPTRKTLRSVKALKKSSTSKRARKTTTEQEKAETYHVPLIVSAPHGVPVSVEVHDDDRHIRTSPDIRPIRPIHLLPLHKPQVEAQPRHYNEEEVFKGPVAVPRDDYYGNAEDVDRSFYDSDRKRIAPGEYYSEKHHHHYEEPHHEPDFSSIPGLPGIDYPTLSELPHTGFRCLMHTSTPGFYADVETKCQMWHYCQPDGRHDRFLCPNGTIFDQATRVCNWWFNVHCESSLNHYDVNFDLYREPIKVNHQVIDVAPSPYLGTPSVPDPAPYLGTPSVSHPNSFLRHVAEFEATRHSNPDHPQGIIEASYPVHSVVHGFPDTKHESVHQEIDDGRHRYGHRGSLIDPVDQYTIHSKLDSGIKEGNHHYGHHDSLIDSAHHVDIGHRYPVVSKIDAGADSHQYGHRDSKLHQDIHAIQQVDDGYVRPVHHHKRYPSKMAPSPLVRHDSIDYDSSNSHSSLSVEKQARSEAKKGSNETEEQRTPLKKRKRIPRRKLRKNHQRKSTRHATEESSTVVPTYREAKVTPAGRRYRIVRRRKENRA